MSLLRRRHKIGFMLSPFLDIRQVRKNFKSFEALRGVSFSVASGELFGLLGPNGAGKTTLLSIVAGLSASNSGGVFLDGKPFDRTDLSARQIIGFGTQDLSLYGELTARENLRFFGRLYGLRGSDLTGRINEVLEFIGLQERADQRASTFSGGMKRRLNLGVAIVHRPRLLLLDEPTTGVDPQSRNHIFERVRNLNKQGTTIIYTSHYMEEVQALCPRIAILDRGQIIACDTVSSLLHTVEGSIRLKINGNFSAVVSMRVGNRWMRIASTSGNEIEIACRDVNGMAVQLINALKDNDVELIDWRTNEPTLEQVFLHLTATDLRD